MSDIFIGTAGWNIPPNLKDRFLSEGSHLEKYAANFNCTEINSSFYREHQYETYKKWRQTVPADFLFSVKLLKYYTHEQCLNETGVKLKNNLNTILGLEEKLGALLIQLPPRLIFNPKTAEKFFIKVKKYCDVAIVLEPRHRSWALPAAVKLLEQLGISKVLADPEPCRIAKAHRPRLEKTIRYFRLHGSPKMYKSLYSPEALNRLHTVLKKPLSPATHTFVIFDNNSYGHAADNALDLTARIHGASYA